MSTTESPSGPPVIAESASLPPQRRVLMLADRLVAQAEAAGVEIVAANTYARGDYLSLTLVPTDDADAPALAFALGLTRRSAQPHKGQVLEAFRGTVDGVPVSTQGLTSGEVA